MAQQLNLRIGWSVTTAVFNVTSQVQKKRKRQATPNSRKISPVGQPNVPFIPLPSPRRPGRDDDKEFISAASHSIMLQNGNEPRVIPSDDESLAVNTPTSPRRPPLQWNWEVEHADRKKERKADAALHGATPFEVDRKVLKDIVREKMGVDVGLITFLSAGEYSVNLITGRDCR